jgi:hypothetical protein
VIKELTKMNGLPNDDIVPKSNGVEITEKRCFVRARFFVMRTTNNPSQNVSSFYLSTRQYN